MQAEDEDLNFDKTLDISMSTAETLGLETPPIHSISVRSTPCHSSQTSDTGGPLLVLQPSISTLTGGFVFDSEDVLDTYIIVDSGDARTSFSVTKDAAFNGPVKMDSEVPAAKEKENIAEKAIVARHGQRSSSRSIVPSCAY